MIKTDLDSDAQDVWAFDIATGKGTPITSDAAPIRAPVWSPDGQQIAYVSVRANTHGLYRRASTGQGNEEMLYQHPTGAPIVLTDWSADGRFLGFWSGDTMFVLPLTGERKAVELGRDDFFGRGGRLSPDSRFLAFNSNASGRFEVYVSPIDPATGTRDPASAGASLRARQGLGRRRHRRHRVAEGRQGAVLSVAAASTNRHGRGLDDRTGIRGAPATTVVRDTRAHRRSRAAQQRQQP